MPSDMFDTEVVVVGAGPIGLTTAIALRHHGIDCVVLEQRTNTKAYSRANNLWARPQELLNSIGLRDPLAEQAYAVRTVNFFMKGVPAAPIRIADVDSPFPEVLYSGQDVIEEVMVGELDTRGGRLERGRKVVALEADDSGVTITDRQGEARPRPAAAGALRRRRRWGAEHAASAGRARLHAGEAAERHEPPGRCPPLAASVARAGSTLVLLL